MELFEYAVVYGTLPNPGGVGANDVEPYILVGTTLTLADDPAEVEREAMLAAVEAFEGKLNPKLVHIKWRFFDNRMGPGARGEEDTPDFHGVPPWAGGPILYRYHQVN